MESWEAYRIEKKLIETFNLTFSYNQKPSNMNICSREMIYFLNSIDFWIYSTQKFLWLESIIYIQRMKILIKKILSLHEDGANCYLLVIE
jgi:hypothetical protein